jgi:hypothetical protein
LCRWNWAALQGAYDGHYDGKVAKLDMYGIVLGISGETLEEVEQHDNKDDYCKLSERLLAETQGISSPRRIALRFG